MNKFKVGDRVRMIREVDGHKAACGAIIFSDDGQKSRNLLLKFDEKQDWAHNGFGEIDYFFGWWVDAEDLQALNEFRLEAGKFYKTRDGRKVGPLVPSNGPYDPEWKFSVNHEVFVEYPKVWRADGTFSPHRDKQHQADLIAEWVEPAAPAKPLVAATVDAISDEYGSGVRAVEPKFKVGDRVKVVSNDHGKVSFVGRLGNVTGVDIGPRSATVVKIDGDSDRYFSVNELDFATPTTSAIVAVMTDGKPRPNERPFVHTSLASAETEAKRLAGIHVGKSFGVYVLTGEPALVPKSYDHEWQRLAANGNKIGAIKELRGISGMGLKFAKAAVEYFVAGEAA